MKFVLFGFGSRGDVQPLVTLAQELYSHKHEVEVVCTWPSQLIRSTFGESSTPISTLASGARGISSPQLTLTGSLLLQAAHYCCAGLLARLFQYISPSWLSAMLAGLLEALHRPTWRTPGGPLRSRSLILWHFQKYPHLFTHPTWKQVAHKLEGAAAVVIAEGGDQPAVERLVLLLCSCLDIPVVPLSCFPRDDQTFSAARISRKSAQLPWFAASLFPGLLRSQSRRSSELQRATQVIMLAFTWAAQTSICLAHRL
ncbi:hypothetical protein CYMTET_38704, partial [Cymbomonas tetramitiformis]